MNLARISRAYPAHLPTPLEPMPRLIDLICRGRVKKGVRVMSLPTGGTIGRSGKTHVFDVAGRV